MAEVFVHSLNRPRLDRRLRRRLDRRLRRRRAGNRGSAPSLQRGHSCTETRAEARASAALSYDRQSVGTNWIKWICILIAVAGLLISIEPEVADGAYLQVASSVPSGALQSPLNSVYCSSPENCLAIGSYFAATTSDGGHSWASHRIGHAGTYLDTRFEALACPTPDICLAFGAVSTSGKRQAGTLTYRPTVARTTDGGRTWTMAAPLPKGVGPILNGLSCPTRSYCLLAGESSYGKAGYALVTTNLGRSWRRLKIPKGDVLSGVTCETRRYCVAVEERFKSASITSASITATNNGGSTWRRGSVPSQFPSEDMSSPTCIGFTRCFIVGWNYQELNFPPAASIFQTNDGGRTWTNDVLPPDTSVLSQISCASAADCVAVGGGWNHGGAGGPPDLLTTSDGGTTWMARSLPASVLVINSISCPTATSCMVVGSAGPNTLEQLPAAVAVTDDGGDTWATP